MKTIAVFFFLICTLHAHKYHFTTSEIEWNEKTKCLEVGLRVDSMDLEKAISLMTKKENVNLETAKDIDKHIFTYVKSNFFVIDTKNKPFLIHWIGKEVAIKETWLFFEVKIVTGDIEGLVFKNSFFFELPSLDAQSIHDQINILNVRWREKTKSLYVNKYKEHATLSFKKQASK